VNLVLFLAKVGSNENQGLEAEDTNRVLFILRKLSEDWEKLSYDMLLLKLG
jgi:hypothetical protein